MNLDLQIFINQLALKNEASKWGLVVEAKSGTFAHFKNWLKRGHHGILGYLTGDKAQLRENIKNYFPEFKSAIVFAFDYAPSKKIQEEFYQTNVSNNQKIAGYVLGFKGLDYHSYLREKLEAISFGLKEKFPEISIKHSLDTQPVLERDLALRAGLGWFGKNSMLINKEIGSFFILGSLFLDIDLSALGLALGKQDTDHCGNCTKCIDACPTLAIDNETRTIVADRCISTFTIELFKEAQAPQGMENGGGEIFGCDICQDVCPWNVKYLNKIIPTDSQRENFFQTSQRIIDFFLKRPLKEIINDLEALSNREYRRIFKSTPLERTGRIGMLKNLSFYDKKKP